MCSGLTPVFRYPLYLLYGRDIYLSTDQNIIMFLAGNSEIIMQANKADKPDATPLMQLLQQCMVGKAQAQRALFEQYGPLVKGVIMRYIYDTELAKDLLNDIFCKVFEKLHLYAPTGPFEGWLRRIAINTIIDHKRKTQKFATTYNTDFADKDISIPEDAGAGLGYKELLAIIQTIPDTQRIVFNLFVFENLTHREIATLLSLTEMNSRWYLNDARRRLKEKILAAGM